MSAKAKGGSSDDPKGAGSSKRRKRGRKPAETTPLAAKTAAPATTGSFDEALTQALTQALAPRSLRYAGRSYVASILDLGRAWAELRPRLPRELRLTARRPDDLLVLDLVFENLKLAGGGPPRLVRRNADAAAYVILEFPPQSFGEEAFLDQRGTVEETVEEDYPEVVPQPGEKGYNKQEHEGYPPKNEPGAAAETVPPLPGARIRMAGPSRIAFRMPQDESSLPLELEKILDRILRWPPHRDVNAVPPPRPQEVGRYDRGWLKEITEAREWSSYTGALLSALAQTGAEALAAPASSAARRIARSTANALATGDTDGLNRHLRESMQDELVKLVKRFPTLEEPAARDAALAVLALESTRELAASRRKFEFDVGMVEKLPFLPILLDPHEPAANVTALELPYRVILSPVGSARWLHRAAPGAQGKRVELWHTRLTTSRDDFGPDLASHIRALWSPDYPRQDFIFLLKNLLPYRMSLDPLDRKMLVLLMAGFTAKDPEDRAYRPRTSQAKRLMLSALGGLLDAEGTWPAPRPAGVGLEQWRHQATLGRDHYVRVVYAGYLCPFGHAASLIKVTERKFESQGSRTNRIAVLRQRFYIVCREPERSYSGGGHRFGGRNFPFTSVEVLTRVTPNLEPPEKSGLPDPQNLIYTETPVVPPRAAFWPLLAPNSDFRFEIAATDLSGQRVTFSMPLLFVGDEANQAMQKQIVAKPAEIPPLLAAYNLETAHPHRHAPLGGATIAFAPVDPGAEGDPRHPAQNLTFDSDALTGISPFYPQFYPQIERADVAIPAMQRLLGKNDSVAVEYPKIYKEKGFTADNPGEVYLKTIQDYPMEFGSDSGKSKSDALGALVTPTMGIEGLSRVVGPAGDLDTIGKDAKFDPAKFFQGAQILGGISIADLLDVVGALTGADVPKMVSRERTNPDRIEASFKWATTIQKSDPAGLFVYLTSPKKTQLAIDSVLSSPLDDPTATTYRATAKLENFKINLFGFVIIWFKQLTFLSQSGSKPDVAVDLMSGGDAVELGGPLEFIRTLRDYIPLDGFSDPPNLDITPSGITASYSLNLPAIQVGVFALSNLSLGAGFSLPFDGGPVLARFNFSERQSPFSLTVSLLGGGGFFALSVGVDGVREIEAALEFGAEAAINLGVASGSVEIKAGVYFHWLEATPGGKVELAGYVRLHGELTVLALISASLTFDLKIAYLKQKPDSIVWGEAKLTVEIDLFIFSAEVSVTCRREFLGAASDPTFVDLIPDQTTWSHYCGAFAEEA